MRMRWRRWDAALLAVGVGLTLAGCGSGGGHGGSLAAWRPYIPAEGDLSQANQVYDVAWEATSPAPASEFGLWASYPGDFADDLIDQLSGGAFSRHRGRAVVEQLNLAVLRQALALHHGGRQDNSDEGDTEEIDTVVNGLHWLGIESMEGGNFNLQLSVESGTTNLTIRANGTVEPDTDVFQLTLTIVGALPDGETDDLANIDLSMNIDVTAQSARGTTDSTVSIQDADGQTLWQEQYQSRYHATQTGNTMQAHQDWNSGWGEQIGSGLYWIRSAGNLDYQGTVDPAAWTSINGTVTVTSSSGFTTTCTYRPDGTVSGQVLDAGEQIVATLSGDWHDDAATLTRPDGNIESIPFYD